MIDAVLFDLDETLLDRTTSLRSFLLDQYGRLINRLGQVNFPAWERRFLELDGRGSVPKSQVYPALLSELGGEPDAAEMLLNDYAMGCCRHARPFPAMADVLRALRKSGKALAVVTNGESAFQRRHIEALQLNTLVDAVLVSEEERLRKPDPKIFLRAASRLAIEPGHCLFVGDNPASDILGAAGAGMQTLWFRCGQAWPSHLPANHGPTIETLPEVLIFAQ
jgi:putative hydrolase of the HAD superfamily